MWSLGSISINKIRFRCIVGKLLKIKEKKILEGLEKSRYMIFKGVIIRFISDFLLRWWKLWDNGSLVLKVKMA